MLYGLCRQQVRQHKIMKGKDEYYVTNIDYSAVVAVLKMYGEGESMFEKILIIWAIEQETKG